LPRPTGFPLLPASLRPPAIALTFVCFGMTVALGGRYAGQSEAGWLDAAIGSRVQARLAGQVPLLSLGLLVQLPAVAVITVLLCGWHLLTGRWRPLTLVLIAVPAAGVATEVVLKPFIGRTHLGGFAFPSGHATAAFAIAVVVAVLLANPPRPRAPALLRLALASAALLAAGLVCVALVATGSHYPTDTVGGATVATAVVLLTALVIDRLAEWRRASTAQDD
jgi:undecaprenyl-diphosphatase